MKNPFGKTTDFDKPHAIYKGGNGFEYPPLKASNFRYVIQCDFDQFATGALVW